MDKPNTTGAAQLAAGGGVLALTIFPFAVRSR